jgi:competence protein ComEA
MKNQISLNLSKRNRRAILYLSILLGLIVYFPRVYFFIKKEDKVSIQSFPTEKWIKSNIKKVDFKNDYSTEKSFKKLKYNSPTSKFDPNEYTKEDWMKLGLSEKQVNVIMNFAKRGLNSNEDLQKIFVISDKLFELIKDSTFYSIKKTSEKFEDKTKVESKKILLDINNATEEQLINLPGIGSFFAKQIIKKRNELGGFYQLEQLKEVWKMDQEKLEVIEPFIKIDNSKIIKIELNKVNLDELKRHPYIRWNIANSIIKIREQKGYFKNIEEIKESVLISEELFEKLKPYLSL